MPNWCENKLAVSGKKKDIINFLKVSEEHGGKFIFNNYLPMPETFIKYDTTNRMRKRNAVSGEDKTPLFKSDEEYENYCKEYKEAIKYQKENYGVVGWYDWSVKNYGTKWDIGEDTAPDIEELKLSLASAGDEDETSITLYFDTAWSPCVEFVENIFKNYPELVFRLTWIETGSFFCGAADFYFDDGEPCIDIEEGEPKLTAIGDTEPLTEEERIKMEKENGYDEWEGFGELYEYYNPFDCE